MSLNQFRDFVISSREKNILSPDKIINDATAHTYGLMNELVIGRNNGDNEVVQSGSKIICHVMLSDAGTYVEYHPNEPVTPVPTDLLRRVEIYWRFGRNYFTYNDVETDLIEGDPEAYHTNLLKAKRQGSATDTFNSWNRNLWRRPEAGQMENGNLGKSTYSIPSFVTFNTNGGVPFTGADAVAWTTVCGLSPTLETGWRNQRVTYDHTQIGDDDVGLIGAFDRMWQLLQWESPSTMKEYWETDRLRKLKIYTNAEGRRIYLRLTRQSNDRLTSGNLGGEQVGLNYAGIPLKWEEPLDTAQGLHKSEAAAIPAGKPLYYWLNLKWIIPVFHGKKYLLEKDPMTHPLQPETHIVHNNTWHNFMIKSRRRQGVVGASSY